MNYEKVKNFLEEYPEYPPYDFNGMLQLVQIGLDNLRKNHMESDLEQFACSLTEEQIRFLEKLIDYKEKFPEE